MTKKASRAPALQLGQSNFDNLAESNSLSSPNALSPLTPNSPLSSTGSTYAKGSTIRSVTEKSALGSDKSSTPQKSPNPSTCTENGCPPPTTDITAIPPFPPSPKGPPKHGREQSRSIFSNFKASRSTHRIQASESFAGKSTEEKPMSRGSSKDRAMYWGRNNSSSYLPNLSENANENSQRPTRQLHTSSGKPSEEPVHAHTLTSKRSKPRFANLLTRSRSIRVDDPFSTARPSATRRPSNGLLRLEEISKEESQAALKTAPLQPEKTFSEAMGSRTRNRSADRPPQDIHNSHPRRERPHPGAISSSISQVTGSALFNNIKQSSTGAAASLGKAGKGFSKGFFGKITRSGSSIEREFPTDDNYVCSVINLPLVEQARRTRISKNLHDSKDKTEYWMPALPWRCIDYLNFKGCEEEGLYRVPGSGKDVKHWQRRFDTELDINLFDEPELYDINTIGSMFKAWLRELPDEILPKDTQAMIAEKCAGATTAPQLLKDELSKLPPFNYYLLFAITCHLSLLHSYVDKNKMDYRNLCICFQPCMKIDGFCFQFLVCDWKNCWQGCWTEKEHLEIELEVQRKAKEPQSNKSAVPNTVEERAISSSGSSQAVGNGSSSESNTKDSSRPASPRKVRKSPPAKINNIGHSRSASQLPELGPPLSPIQI